MMGLGFGRLAFAPHMGGGFLGLAAGAFTFVLFAIAVVLVIVLLYRASSKTSAPVPAQAARYVPPADAALLILRERLVRGEVDSVEYERLAALLARTT